MFSSKCVAVRDSDVSTWSCNNNIVKITVNEVCARFGVDIDNDRRNRFFWKIQLDKKVIVNEELLNWLGYSGSRYYLKKTLITKLLAKNPHIQYEEITDEKDCRKKYYVLDAIDFEGIMMQMRTEKVRELRELFSLMKMIVVKYCEYEKFYEKHSAELLRQQNYQLIGSVNELKSLVLTVKEDGDERERRAEEERRKAEEERTRAEERERRAEERSRRLSTQIENNIKRLRRDIAPNVVPAPINPSKVHRLGLYRTALDGEWYLMRRQREAWRDAERRLYNRSMIQVRVWDNVSHAVDVGNTLKRRCRRLTWYARGNIIRVPEEHRAEIREETIVGMIETILTEENAAHRLANDNANVL